MSRSAAAGSIDPPMAPVPGHAMPPTERYVSEAEYWAAFYDLDDITYEWNNGRLEEKPVSDFLTYQVYAWAIELLHRFLEVQPIARPIGLDRGFRMALPGRVVIRKPDLGLVRDDNPVPLGDLDTSYRGIFDLCIEALSDATRAGRKRDEVTKRDEYAQAGVREYWILHREPDKLALFGLGNDGLYRPLPIIDGVVRSAVLPGFAFRVEDLIARSRIDRLRHDPVYQGFVHPSWREAEAAQVLAKQAQVQAERQRQQAEQQRVLAEQARGQAERARGQAEQERDALLRARHAAVARLTRLGLTPAQIAEALDLPPDADHPG